MMMVRDDEDWWTNCMEIKELKVENLLGDIEAVCHQNNLPMTLNITYMQSLLAKQWKCTQTHTHTHKGDIVNIICHL